MTTPGTDAPLTPQALARGATLLTALRLRLDGRRRPIAELPADCRPRTLDDAYRMQALVRRQLAERADGPGAVAGWKIGCTTPVMQRYLNIPHPCAGTLYRRRLYRDRDTLTLDPRAFFRLGLECELAVELAHDLPARAGGYDGAGLADSGAIAGVMTSVEIVEHRFVDFARAETASLVADDFFSAGCLVGASRPLADLGALRDLRGGFALDGVDAERGDGSAILGDPLNALAWLADHCAAQREPLRRGQIVTLGSVVKTLYPDDLGCRRVDAVFDGLAPVTVTLAR